MPSPYGATRFLQRRQEIVSKFCYTERVTDTDVLGRFSTVMPSPASDMIRVDQVSDGEFRVSVSGLWTPDFADTHFRGLKASLDHARATCGGVRVLVDLRNAAVQTMPTAARVQFWTETIYRPQDRVAMLVASSIVKQQMRRVATITLRELFLSEAAAVTWLRAECNASGESRMAGFEYRSR